MIDDMLRTRFKTQVERTGVWLARRGVTATGMTGLGFAFGISGCLAVVSEAYITALLLLILNRVADLFDGAIARATKVTDFGGFIDILFDLLIYSGYVLAFAIARPENALPAAVLIYTFLATGASFLAAANIAAKRGITREPPSRKSFFYKAALIEGVETTGYLIVVCLLPDHFAVITYVFAVVSWLSVLGHFRWARQFH